MIGAQQPLPWSDDAPEPQEPGGPLGRLAQPRGPRLTSEEKTLPRAGWRRRLWASAQRAAQTLFDSPLTAAATLVIALAIGASLLAPFLTPYDPAAQDGYAILSGASPQHWLGTDGFGRDLLARLLYGGRISLLVAIASTVVALVAGSLAGAVAGYFGGWPDYVLSRCIDALMAFPPILLALVFAAAVGIGVASVVLAVGIAYIPLFALVARGAILCEREEPYVLAAISIGVKPFGILRKHILPNVLTPLIAQASSVFPMAILTEAALSFLGLGAPPSSPSWGVMLHEGNRYLTNAPHVILAPLVTVCLTTWAFNVFGDRLIHYLDPRRATVRRQV
jgi:peptide/nickel transport system permease protein